MRPSIKITITQVGDIAVIDIPKGESKPYSVGGNFYIRQGANSQKMNREELRDFFREQGHVSFETQVIPEFLTRDFSSTLFNHFKTRAQLHAPKETILQNLGLKTRGMLNKI